MKPQRGSGIKKANVCGASSMVKKKTKAKPKKLKKIIKKPAKKPAPKLNKFELLRSGCKLWDRITTKAFNSEYWMPKEINRYGRYGSTKGPLYSSGDYGALGCRITGSLALAELTVGSSSGHKAKLDLNNHTLKYFDPRKYNNWTMWEILKPLKCKRDETGVQCTGIKTKAQILHVFRALAMPTSMDFRQSHCEGMTTTEKCRQAEVKYFKSGPKHTVLVKT